MGGMFSLWNRGRDVGFNRRHARLGFEALESRVCPSKGFAISIFNADARPNHVAELTGKVVDIDPPSVKLTFFGGVQGSTCPDADGNFSYTTTNASLGLVYVKGVNSLNMEAGNQDPLTVPRPVISLGIQQGEKASVTLFGSITDIDPSNLVVTFKGKAKGAVTADDEGNFSYTTNASGLGEVNAFTVNDWGLRGLPASVNVFSVPPQIIGFTAEKSPDLVWSFSGTVTDESPAGLVVHFSNFSEIEGKTATVGSDGEFCLTVVLHVSQPVQIHADVSDWWGLAADGAWVNLNP